MLLIDGVVGAVLIVVASVEIVVIAAVAVPTVAEFVNVVVSSPFIDIFVVAAATAVVVSVVGL